MLLPISLLLLQLPPIKPFADELRHAVSYGDKAAVTAAFMSPSDSDYLFQMADDRGGLRKLKVAIIPYPPGWEASAKYWAIIHTRQDIEEDHDPVYPIVVVNDRWKLGPEIPEDSTVGLKITNARLDVTISPATHRADIKASLDLQGTRLTRAPLFRLNDDFTVNGAIEVGDDIPTPKPGQIVHAGSLLIPWTKTAIPNTFDYSGTINTANEDKIDEKACYLTAWWTPTLGRSPFTTWTRVVGPSDWVLQSEGDRIDKEDSPFKESPTPKEGMKEEIFHCPIPISYPKVIGGKYIIAAEAQADGRTYRIYHFDDSEQDRAKRDLKNMMDAIQWYDQHLGPFPFKEYSCYDADTYYGIESYNYTLLNRRITTWAVGHEAGHTYFGGLVPCAYVHDTWNESMTQYVDSVLRQNNADQTLQAAIRPQALATKVPLTEMPVAHAYGSLTYYRGAYVLRMLENEIGTENMYKSIRAMIADRRGKDTTWFDLRPYFEKSAGKSLERFWRQWIAGATFPKLEITDAQGVPTARGTEVHVTVRQSGTPSPFRLRFRVWAKGLTVQDSKVVEMRSPEAVFTLNLGREKAYQAGIDPFGYTMSGPVPSVTITP